MPARERISELAEQEERAHVRTRASGAMPPSTPAGSTTGPLWEAFEHGPHTYLGAWAGAAA